MILFENLPSRTRLAFPHYESYSCIYFLIGLKHKSELYFYPGSRYALWFKSDYEVVRLVNTVFILHVPPPPLREIGFVQQNLTTVLANYLINYPKHRVKFNLSKYRAQKLPF